MKNKNRVYSASKTGNKGRTINNNISSRSIKSFGSNNTNKGTSNVRPGEISSSRRVYQPLDRHSRNRNSNLDENLDFFQSNSNLNQNRNNNNNRRKRKHGRIKIIPCLILFVVILLLVFGISKIITNIGQESFEEKYGDRVDMYLPTYAEDVWDELLYVGEDIFNGSDNLIVMSQAEYDAYLKQMGGEENLKRNLYLRNVAKGNIQLDYMRDGSIYHVDTNKKIVALSFDDGPSAETIDKYLAILKEYNATATFFMLGQYMQSDYKSVNKILDSGHEPATHTWSHKNFNKCTSQVIAADLSKSIDGFRHIVGHNPYLMRCPYGNITDDVKAINKEVGMISVMWDVDTLDWEAKTPEQILNFVKRDVSPGSIILMHEGKEINLQALPAVLKYLTDQGYQVVSVGELLWQAHLEDSGSN